MKKALCVFLLCAVITPASAENIDLSSLSFDELRHLQTRISVELASRPEWKVVAVPPGVYLVGVDIPAGDWCLTCSESVWERAYVCCGMNLNPSKTEVVKPYEWRGYIHKAPYDSGKTTFNVTLHEGEYIEILDGTILFTVPEKIDLGF